MKKESSIVEAPKYASINSFITPSYADTTEYFKSIGNQVQTQTSSGQLTSEQFKENLESTGGFLLFILTGAVSMAYFVTFKTYHSSLDKLDTLKELLANPNARVATREQGTKIMEAVNLTQLQEQAFASLQSPSSVDSESLVRQLSQGSQTFN